MAPKHKIETRKREHSRKPDEQYQLIESCSPGPVLELFARYPRDRWDSWGAEAGKEVTPQGKQFKGYAGGNMKLPDLGSHERIPDENAMAIGRSLKCEYEAGYSINDIASKHGYSIQRTRSLLLKADTKFRKRGRARQNPHMQPPV